MSKAPESRGALSWWRAVLAVLFAVMASAAGPCGTADAVPTTRADGGVTSNYDYRAPAAKEVSSASRGLVTVTVGGVRDRMTFSASPRQALSILRVGVAAKTADHVLPIGPGSEKAWSVLNRVDAKGAPLNGYKGGGVFENSKRGLPETPGVTYRKWDPNPNVKGIDRGAERLVTGSDGRAYWTGDHYKSFLMFRGPTG